MIKKVKGKTKFHVGEVEYDTLAEAQRASLIEWFEGAGAHGDSPWAIADAIASDPDSFREVVKPFFSKKRGRRKPKAAVIEIDEAA